jgi:DNA-binding GntR family transcriptional regulator
MACARKSSAGSRGKLGQTGRLVEASDNRFFIDTIRRVHRMQRLLPYRSTRDRERYVEHAKQHLP